MRNRIFMRHRTEAGGDRSREPVVDNPCLILRMDHRQASIVAKKFCQPVPLQQVDYALVYEVKLKAAGISSPSYKKTRHGFIKCDTTNRVASKAAQESKTVARLVLERCSEPCQARVQIGLLRDQARLLHLPVPGVSLSLIAESPSRHNGWGFTAW